MNRRISEALKERANFVCEICDKQRGTNHHHRVNKSRGGRDDLCNLMWLCGSGTTGCHGWVTENPERSQQRGWSVSGYRDPATVPVKRRGEWVMLFSDGDLVTVPEPAGGRVA